MSLLWKVKVHPNVFVLDEPGMGSLEGTYSMNSTSSESGAKCQLKVPD